jgi:hypothetical protein
MGSPRIGLVVPALAWMLQFFVLRLPRWRRSA